METQQLMQQFQQLPTQAQRIVIELIELLSKQSEPAFSSPPEEATIIPHTALGGARAWPGNEFMDPAFYGSWSDREEITDSGEYVRNLRRKQWNRRS